MGEQQTILVGLANPRTAEHLVRAGIEVARAQSARLVIVSIVIVSPGESLSKGAREARAQRRLLRRASIIASAELQPAETLVRAGHSVDEALIEVAAEVNATLLIVGWAPTTRFGDAAETPMWRLSQDLPCDVLSVKAAGLSVRPQRILLPLRGGLHADLAAALGVALAKLWGASVTMLRVIPAYVPHADAQAEDAAFRQYWEELYPGVARARSVVAPSVVGCLVREAKDHDLIVMGASATSRSYPYPFGQITEEIAERVSCPIFVAKTEHPMVVEDFSHPPLSGARDRHEDAPEDISMLVDKWFAENTYHSKEFAVISDLVSLKQQQGLTVSLVLPTLNEEQTIGEIIDCMRDNLQERYPLIDDMIVVDSRSQDHTVAIARSRGVPVYVHQELLPQVGSYAGKGEALWKSLSVATGDIVAWIDTDIANIHPKFVYGLLGPLLREPRLGYVKGFYRRPLREGGTLHEASGGRVTELMARPLINSFYPLLSGLIQPLSGEYAGRRDLLTSVPFSTGYGVEIGLLIDIVERYGLQAIAQVDLEQRVHRNQSLSALSRMSFTILQTVLKRLERQRHVELVADTNRTMKAIVHTREHFHLDIRHIEDHERPPMAEVLLAPV